MLGWNVVSDRHTRGRTCAIYYCNLNQQRCFVFSVAFYAVRSVRCREGMGLNLIRWWRNDARMESTNHGEMCVRAAQDAAPADRQHPGPKCIPYRDRSKSQIPTYPDFDIRHTPDYISSGVPRHLTLHSPPTETQTENFQASSKKYLTCCARPNFSKLSRRFSVPSPFSSPLSSCQTKRL